MAFCTKCGAQVQGPFCGSCGAPAPASAGPSTGGVSPGASAPRPPAPPPPPVSAPPSSAPPASAPVAAAKTSPLVWILGGCGGLIVLAALVGGMALYYIGHKAKQFGDLAQRNPAMAVAKLMAAANPDIEVVSVDDKRGVMTVRDKKTGKVLTMNLADAQKGKFVFSAPGEKPVTLEAHGDGASGSLEVKSGEGSMKIGAGAAEKVPNWVPTYPGTTPQNTFSMQNDKENSGSFTLTTKDSIDQVVRYYGDALKQAGLKVTTNVIQSDGKASMGIVTAEEAGDKRKAAITVTIADGATKVGVTFTARQ